MILELAPTTGIFPPDEFFDILDWCWATCSGKFVYNHVHEANWHEPVLRWAFEFEDEEDKVKFILRWL